MGSTTEKPVRLGVNADLDKDDQVRELIAKYRNADPPMSWKQIAEKADVSLSALRRIRKAKVVDSHDPLGTWYVWLAPVETGGEVRLVGRIVGTTTTSAKYAARWATEGQAKKWLADHRHEACIGGVNITPHRFNPLVVDFTTI